MKTSTPITSYTTQHHQSHRTTRAERFMKKTTISYNIRRRVVLLLLLLLAHTTTTVVLGSNTYPITDASQTECYDEDGVVLECSTMPLQDGGYVGLTQQYCDNDDDTVTDMRTGLTWTKTLYGKMTLAEANAPFTLAGHTDWRVPTMKELYSLIDFDGKTGASEVENTPYVNDVFETLYGEDRHIDGQIWSSTEYVDEVFGKQKCNFGLNPVDGRIKCYPQRSRRKDSVHYVRYVRGHTDVGVNDFAYVGNDVIQDRATGLQWMRYDSGFYEDGGPSQDGKMDWPDALQYCENLSLGGHSDWRLPDAHALQSIVDYSRSPATTGSAAIDPSFDCTPIVNEAAQADYGWYWTSDTHLDGKPLGSNAVYVAFGRATGKPKSEVLDVHGAGAQRSDPKVGPNEFPDGRGPQGDMIRIYNFVRCVRGDSSSSDDAPTTCNGSRYPRPKATHPPIVGGVDTTSAVIGARIVPAGAVAIRYSTTANFANSQTTGYVSTSEETDYTAAIQLNGLAPNTKYYYRLVLNGHGEQATFDPALVQEYSFTTMPLPGTEARVAVFADVATSRTEAPAYAMAAAQAEATLALQIGDFDHGDPGNEGHINAYRDMHKTLRDPATTSGLAFATNVLSHMAFDHVWDDHDYCANDEDRDCTTKDLALQAYDEYYPGFDRSANTGGGIYHKFTVADAEFFVLDDRWNRSPNDSTDDDSKTMLGEEQREWLIQSIIGSDAIWKIIISSVSGNPTARAFLDDHWISFQTEASYIREKLVEANVENAVLISADLHTGGAVDDGTNSVFSMPELGVPHTNLPNGNDSNVGTWSEGWTPGTGNSGYGTIVITPQELTLSAHAADTGFVRHSITLTPGDAVEDPVACANNGKWFFPKISKRDGTVKKRRCNWVSKKPSKRCKKKSEGGVRADDADACPVACGTC